MNREFEEKIKKLPGFMESLRKSPCFERKDSRQFPDKGIYVFFENGKPLYVGRSEKMRKRIMQHGRRSSGHNSATFAFLLAKEKAHQSGINAQGLRGAVENDGAFRQIYYEMKDRVSKMKIKVVEVTDPVEQTLFEVYAALELKTQRYNEWGTH